jgi:uncharacterized protein (TIGR01777 family)
VKILMTGATGFVGKELGIELVKRGHQIVAVSRDAQRARMDLPFPCEVYEWKGQLPPQALRDVEAVVHLTGETVTGRWTAEKKKKIRQTRVDQTTSLFQVLRENKGLHKISTFVSASAIGIYGDRGAATLTEDAEAGQGFLAQVCLDWEKAGQEGAHSIGARYAAIRIGVVLGKGGGALKEMVPLFQKGLGGVLGAGTQYMSWIHLQDLVSLFSWAVENSSVKGVLNGTAPHPVTNAQFTQSLCEALKCMKGIPAPALALRTLLGEMSSIVLASQNVIPKRSLDMNFTFQYPTLTEALRSLFGDLSKGESEYLVKQWVPKTQGKVFEYFCDEMNLESLTPPWLNFKVLSKSTKNIQVGTLIQYKLRIKGVPAKWTTEIKDWNPPHSFVDNQNSGPYKRWHHTHSFETLGEGTLMTDRVIYQVPLGFIGKLFAGPMVDGDVNQIFSYRRKTIFDLFCR